MSDNILTRTIANVTYDFAMRGEDQEVLCLRTVGEIWRDAFRYFAVITGGSARYSDQLHNIMTDLAEQEDSASIYALETSGDVAYNEAYRGLDSDMLDC